MIPSPGGAAETLFYLGDHEPIQFFCRSHFAENYLALEENKNK